MKRVLMTHGAVSSYGKTIEMFLVDGTAEGIVTAELSNWNGKAIKLPRTAVAGCKREDVKNVGVYFLFCEEADGAESVYVGEAEDVLKRLGQHLHDYRSGKESYYWATAVVFTGRDLNKALIRFLEDRLVSIARDCGRSAVLTQNTYRTHLKEAQIATMEEFIDNIKVLLSALGYRTLLQAPAPSEAETYLFCKSGGGANGKGFVSSNGFTVLRGSRVSDHVVPSFETRGRAYFELRKRLCNEGTIADDVFTRDYEFSAPSAASAVLLGRTSNGNVDWKTAEMVPLRDVQQLG